MPDARALFADFDQEMATTRTLLERVPEDRAGWAPHPKSTTLGGLATHIPALVGLAATAMVTEEVDMNPPGGGGYTPPGFTTTAALLAEFDAQVAKARAAIDAASDEELQVPWSLKTGGHTIFTIPRAAVVRSMVINHVVHHRGQLSVYLRLNDVPLPSIYGPTADTAAGA
ncbi:MAG TPA: DinB family protein [Longimicrobiaceae bacterium]|nr:DinB family protein [Longimicrobiaceae bacterium]